MVLERESVGDLRIGEQPLQEGEGPEQTWDNQRPAIAILDTRRMYDCMKQETYVNGGWIPGQGGGVKAGQWW